jgi:hypothetical protein
MKPKADPAAELVYQDHLHVQEVQQAMRVMDHVQSGLRQLTFGLSALIPTERRTPEVDAHLAALHEDEAHYHEREAAWLRNKAIDARSFQASDGASGARASRGASSTSRGKGRKRSSTSRAPAPAEG